MRYMRRLDIPLNVWKDAVYVGLAEWVHETEAGSFYMDRNGDYLSKDDTCIRIDDESVFALMRWDVDICQI